MRGKGESLFVLARCRPYVAREQGTQECVKLVTGQLADGDAPEVALFEAKPSGKGKVFNNCHAVIDSRSPGSGTQEDVYNLLKPRTVETLFDGVSSCVFAYGQTGTGKSGAFRSFTFFLRLV